MERPTETTMTKLDREYLKLYHALINQPESTGRVLRARLLAVLQERELGLTALATAMGKGKPTYSRKLYVDHAGARPLLVSDIDAILEHLGADPDAILRAVLLPGDRVFLQRTNAAKPPTVDDISGAEATMRAVRLRAQGLIKLLGNHLVATRQGRRTLRR
jgi:hypothetical protein